MQDVNSIGIVIHDYTVLSLVAGTRVGQPSQNGVMILSLQEPYSGMK